MKTNFKAILCAVLALVCGMFMFTACDSGNGPGGIKTYTLEAEYIDLDNVTGAGISSSVPGVEMIFGEGTADDKAKGWSQGYYVGFTHSADLTLDFVFNSDAAGSATIIIRLGSELGDITLDSNKFAVKLNGEPFVYSNIFIAGNAGEMNSMDFFDKTITTTASLVEGENTISLTVMAGNGLNSGQVGGPMIDCIKIKTSATLTWTEKTDNPGRRGEI